MFDRLQHQQKSNFSFAKKLQVASFYRFVPLTDARELCVAVENYAEKCHLRGTVLLAPEGINVNLAGQQRQLADFFRWLGKDERLRDCVPCYSNFSATAEAGEPEGVAIDLEPFRRLKVLYRQQIIDMGVEGVNLPSLAANYAEGRQWHSVLAKKQWVLLDVRNDYEYRQGTFTGAENPGISQFKDFPQWIRQRWPDKANRAPTSLAIFCTGGVRCEKAAPWLYQQGFAEVLQLKGGILKYLQNMPLEQSLWQGSCFVFDRRENLPQSH